jgi:heptosyltransferase III
MKKQLVPAQILAGADKVLFITHLAIGDFLYWQTYFKAFHERYPHIKIHVWVDEIRRTWKWWKWAGLRRYSLYDWLKACPFIEKVYCETYSPFALFSSIKMARVENYPLIIALTTLRAHKYALIARLAGPKAFVAGFVQRMNWSWFHIIPSLLYRVLDARCPQKVSNMEPGYHITDLYAAWFEKLFGMEVAAEARRPFMDIPRDWRTNARLTLLKWGVTSAANGREHKPKTVFINIFAKDKKRCWTVGAAFDLIDMLKAQEYFSQAFFIVNTMPGELRIMQQALRQRGASNVILFSAQEHFFQLPAIIELCDLVVSVETAVMHIAAALKVPVVALMRTKNPEWVPWDKDCSRVLMAAKRTAWVKNIPPTQVLHEVSAFVREAERKVHV